jgi:mono/diheme cytochrome c family protein
MGCCYYRSLPLVQGICGSDAVQGALPDEFKVKSHVIAVVALAVTGLPVYAQESGDPVRGLAVAQAQCASCHALYKGAGLSPDVRAPTFETVAAVPGMTAIALNAFLQTSHATMPNIILAPEDRRNIVAYILSLKPN